LTQDDLLQIKLRSLFNFNTFRPGQKEIIQDVLKGQDVFGILPTGTGKSLCYQLPARILDGSTIVISPLISLMIDQVNQLRANQFKDVVALTSFMEYRERQHVLKNLASYKLIYVSPELIQSPEILPYFKKLKVSLFVIDEAHCISQWGHEFRPDYLRLTHVIQSINNPPILALSATATEEVQHDIMTILNRPNMVKHIYPMDRENIAFCVYEVADDRSKLKAIKKLLSDYHTPTIIYFSSRRTTEEVSNILSQKLPERRIAFYHGGMDHIDRITIQQQFMNNQLDIICCTNAFGMGIDKDNIRLVIHYHFPTQLESYIQEVGRAGRDGSASVSVLFYARQDESLSKRLILNEIPTEEDLYFVFQKLFELVQNHDRIPTTQNEADIANTFQLSETQWRFIHFQLEKNGIIIDNQIIYDKESWKQAYENIKLLQKRRLTLKYSKLIDMIDWMNEKECLRKHLYKGFQSSFQKPSFQCCNNCQFSLSNWLPIQSKVNQELFTSWDHKLRSLLFIGEDHETK